MQCLVSYFLFSTRYKCPNGNLQHLAAVEDSYIRYVLRGFRILLGKIRVQPGVSAPEIKLDYFSHLGWSPHPPVEEVRAVGDRPPGEGLWAGQEGGAVAALVAHLDTGVDVESQVVRGHLGKNNSRPFPPALPGAGRWRRGS